MTLMSFSAISRENKRNGEKMNEELKQELTDWFSGEWKRVNNDPEGESVVYQSLLGRFGEKMDELASWDDETLLGTLKFMAKVLQDCDEASVIVGESVVFEEIPPMLQAMRNWMASENLIELTLQEMHLWLGMLMMIYMDNAEFRMGEESE